MGCHLLKPKDQFSTTVSRFRRVAYFRASFGTALGLCWAVLGLAKGGVGARWRLPWPPFCALGVPLASPWPILALVWRPLACSLATVWCFSVPVWGRRAAARGFGSAKIAKSMPPPLAHTWEEVSRECALRRRCSMDMWCLDGIGREIWEWETPYSVFGEYSP